MPVATNRGKCSVMEIRSGVPLPKKQVSKSRGWAKTANRYPFLDMQSGDSFEVRCADGDLKRLMNSLNNCRKWYQDKTGWKFALRVTPHGIGVWRTE